MVWKLGVADRSSPYPNNGLAVAIDIQRDGERVHFVARHRCSGAVDLAIIAPAEAMLSYRDLNNSVDRQMLGFGLQLTANVWTSETRSKEY